MTLRTRVALAAAIATAVVAVAFTVTAVLSTRAEIRDQVDSQLLDQAHGAAVVVADVDHDRSAGPGPTTGFSPSGDETYSDPRFRGTGARIIASDGDVIVPGPFRNLEVTESDRDVAAGEHGGATYHDVAVGVHTYRVVTVPAGGFAGHLVAAQAARQIDDIDTSIRNLTLLYIGLGIGGVLLALLLGLVVSRSAIGPVARLGATAAHVADTEDLSVVVPESGGAELAGVARSFNRMLGTLRSSREQQRRLVADAGHELRTPLTSLRTNIEVLEAGGMLDREDRAALLRDVDGQIEELSDLVADLVELARSDESARAEFADVRLDDVVRDALTRARRRAASIEFDVRLEPMVLDGQPTLLERAVLNLLDNAVKWSPPNGTVTVRLDANGLSVADQGPGIDVADREHVFERFWRATGVRAQPGSGLGLAIVHQVVTAHSGSATIEDAPGGGTLVRLRLPAVPIDVVGSPPGNETPPGAVAGEEGSP